jgi:tetratricopeptide (TPR) repeat protein
MGRTAAMGRFLALAERLLGRDDVALVRILTSRIRAAEAEWDQAARLQCSLRAAEVMRANFGAEHPWVLVFHEEAASMLAFQGDARGAIEHAMLAARIRNRIPESARDLVMFGNAERNLAWFLALDEQYEPSLAAYERAIALLTNVVGPEQHLVALSELGMAFCSSQLGRSDDAERLIEAAWGKLSRMPQLFPDQRAHARFVRGHVLVKLGRIEEGEKELRGAWDDMYKDFAPPFAWRRVLADDLATIARARGDAQDAAAWEARKEQPRVR